jgi:hypothetical protein
VGQNPPDGAIIDYSIGAGSGPVTLEIYDSKNALLRRYSSEDKPETSEAELEKELHVPTYWVRPTRILSAAAGVHRFVWDLHYPPPRALQHEYPIAAIYHDTPRVPLGPWVLPDQYTLKLTAAGESRSQALTVVMDPRVNTPMEELEKQRTLSLRVSDMMREDYDAVSQIRQVREQIKNLEEKQSGNLKDSLTKLDNQLGALQGGAGSSFGARAHGAKDTLSLLNSELSRVLEVLEGTDNGPTTHAVAAVQELQTSLQQQLSSWNQLKAGELNQLNEQLRRANLPEVVM